MRSMVTLRREKLSRISHQDKVLRYNQGSGLLYENFVEANQETR